MHKYKHIIWSFWLWWSLDKSYHKLLYYYNSLWWYRPTITLMETKIWPFSKYYFWVAIVDKLAVGAGFQMQLLPHVNAIAAFQPYTAIGKLNAVITPTAPTGFQFSNKACPGPERDQSGSIKNNNNWSFSQLTHIHSSKQFSYLSKSNPSKMCICYFISSKILILIF